MGRLSENLCKTYLINEIKNLKKKKPESKGTFEKSWLAIEIYKNRKMVVRLSAGKSFLFFGESRALHHQL